MSSLAVDVYRDRKYSVVSFFVCAVCIGYYTLCIVYSHCAHTPCNMKYCQHVHSDIRPIFSCIGVVVSSVQWTDYGRKPETCTHSPVLHVERSGVKQIQKIIYCFIFEFILILWDMLKSNVQMLWHIDLKLRISQQIGLKGLHQDAVAFFRNVSKG